MISGCALWLGRGSSNQYFTSITSFILKNSEDTKVTLFYSKNKYNLPENFKDLYQAFQQQGSSLLLGYDVLIDRIDFCDIDTNFKNDKYVAWLEQFEPTPYAFISDYLRFAMLFKLAFSLKDSNDLIAFFELDVEFKESLPDDVPVDTVTLPEHESALYLILVNKPQQNSIILLANIVKVYNDLYEKILSKLDVENNPSSLDILENEGFVTRTLDIDLGIPEQTPNTTSALSAGHVNLRGFYKVVQGLALEVMRDCDDEMGPGEFLSAIDVAQLIDHFPGSIESVYKKDAYKLKRVTIAQGIEDTSASSSTEQGSPKIMKPSRSVFFAETVRGLEDTVASSSTEQGSPKIMKPSRSVFFDETSQASKRTKIIDSICSEVVNEDGPPF